MKGTYTIVLTHDMDHMAKRNVPLMSKATGSYLKRCIISNFGRWKRKDLVTRQYLHSVLTALSLPLVRAGIARDPMETNRKRLMAIEKEYNVRSTLFFIPYKDVPGHIDKNEPAPLHRKADYDVNRYGDLLAELEENGWEVGIHGIDAHLGEENARKELDIFKRMLPKKEKWGIRMHWLYQPQDLWKTLKKAGFYYDATYGFNDLVGFPEQHYVPFKKDGLWVLPLNIQDGTLLAPWREGISMAEAWNRIRTLMDEAGEKGAVLTFLWHNLSFGPHRYWDGLYRKIIEAGLRDGAEFLTAGRAIDKFENREDTSRTSG
jgi:peptidoglycan/xylan/chitin deacetylase (PgdA/CDA1 family)